MDRTHKLLYAIAAIAFIYAAAGNYVALPGYLRFLERGGTSEAGNALDLAVVIGATKTVLWMLSFNIGALCLYFSGLRTGPRSYLIRGMWIGSCWLIFWVWPELPRVGSLFYIGFGSLILMLIFATSYTLRRPETEIAVLGERRFWLLTSLLFFAMGTWDVCGLGSTGRILHPELVVLDRSQLLLAAQTTKLMMAFLFAWMAIAFAFIPRDWYLYLRWRSV